MQASSDIISAQQYLGQRGYESTIKANGSLVVQDPVKVGGCDGRLITCGSRPVTISSYSDARQFVSERS